MTYRVGLARRDGSAEAWVFDLPGCRAVGASVDEVLQLLPVVIGEFEAWLSRHGDVQQPHANDYKVVENVDASKGPNEFVFEADEDPAGEDYIEGIARCIGYAHEDLLALTSSLPDVVLDWRVPPSAVKIDSIFPDVRSLRDMMLHVASAMNFHVRGVGDAAKRLAWPDGVVQPEAAKELTLARLRALSEEERSGRVYRFSGPRGEAAWTARKSMRRVINHQRFHAREIEQRLCWLTLGVPEVMPVSRE